jgi:hypothetical protein
VHALAVGADPGIANYLAHGSIYLHQVFA